jgi:hypothetical protein
MALRSTWPCVQHGLAKVDRCFCIRAWYKVLLVFNDESLKKNSRPLFIESELWALICVHVFIPRLFQLISDIHRKRLDRYFLFDGRNIEAAHQFNKLVQYSWKLEVDLRFLLEANSLFANSTNGCSMSASASAKSAKTLKSAVRVSVKDSFSSRSSAR